MCCRRFLQPRREADLRFRAGTSHCPSHEKSEETGVGLLGHGHAACWCGIPACLLLARGSHSIHSCRAHALVKRDPTRCNPQRDFLHLGLSASRSPYRAIDEGPDCGRRAIEPVLAGFLLHVRVGDDSRRCVGKCARGARRLRPGPLTPLNPPGLRSAMMAPKPLLEPPP